MGHKANESFFDEKKPWSKRKDMILEYYLFPYLAKVGKLKRPILLVDGFAGPGLFGDGNLGSPLIMCEKAQEAALRGTDVRVMCIEAIDQLHSQLTHNTESFGFAETRHGRFLQFIPEIERMAKTHTVFLYVDPYAVEGLEWEAMDRVFRHLDVSGMSIEILLNFNAVAFARRGRAALKIAPPVADGSETDDMSDHLEMPYSPIERLDRVAGGDWWQEVVQRGMPFDAEVSEVVTQYCRKLRQRFREVCHHSIKEHWQHIVPKYVLVFGSRTQHGLRLMNDAAVRSREMFAESTAPKQQTLFETRPIELVPEQTKLSELVLKQSMVRMQRGHLIRAVMANAFGDFSETQIRRCITGFIKHGNLCSVTGKARITDDVEVWNIRAHP